MVDMILILTLVNEPVIDKCLKGNIKTPNLKSQLIDLQYFNNIEG